MREIVEKLLNDTTNVSKLSKDSGVPYMTLSDLVKGKTAISDARFKTIEALYNYALKLESKSQKWIRFRIRYSNCSGVIWQKTIIIKVDL